MRNVHRRRSIASLVAWTSGALGAFASIAAACTPGSFDGITGGAPLDDGGRTDVLVIEAGSDDLPPPRPLGPLSGSWVNGLRPRFRWELPIGVRDVEVEVARDRDFTSVKRFATEGPAIELTEDLEPGMWFWRLRSVSADGTIGQAYSPIWEVLVRGGVGLGHAGGSIVDINGDGRPDLLLFVAYLQSTEGDPYYEAIGVAATNEDSTDFALERPEGPIFGVFAPPGDQPLASVDVNGDGYSDIFTAADPARVPPIQMLFGAPTSPKPDGVDVPNLPVIAETPSLVAAGDLDGDGYGDIAFGTPAYSYVGHGSADGIGLLQLVLLSRYRDGGPGQPPTTLASFSSNDDALGDLAVVVGPPNGPAPIGFLRGSQTRGLETTYEPILEPTSFTLPTRLVPADVDGDGASDMAFVTTIAGKTAVCAFSVATPAISGKVRCWSPDVVPAGFGASASACDIEGDGKDEILVGTTQDGVYIVSFAGEAPSAELVAGPFGAAVTTIHPGRPGAGVWAASSNDGSGIAIHKGKNQVRVLSPPFGAIRFGVSLR